MKRFISLLISRINWLVSIVTELLIKVCRAEKLSEYIKTLLWEDSRVMLIAFFIAIHPAEKMEKNLFKPNSEKVFKSGK